MQLPEIDWARAGRGAVIGGWVMAGAALVAGWIICVPRLEAYAATHQPGGTADVSFVDPPEWLDAELAESLRNTAAAHITADPLSRHDLNDARQALLATGWVTEVRQVSRLDAHRVTIDAVFARPMAVIRDGERDYLVDVHGHLMPRSYEAGTSGLIVVVGAQYNRPAYPGLMWPGNDVTAGLQVVQLIERRPWREQITEVNVKRHWREQTLTLATDAGCTIAWGRAPGDEGGTEVAAEQKLSYLDYHHEEYGHVDRGLKSLDIRGDVVIGQ